MPFPISVVRVKHVPSCVVASYTSSILSPVLNVSSFKRDTLSVLVFLLVGDSCISAIAKPK